MKVSTINSFPKFQSITEEHRKPAVEQPVYQGEFQPHHKKINPATATGWFGVGALAVSVLSGIKRMPKLHKISAFAGAIAIASHVGIISSFHHAHHHNNIPE